MDKRKWPWKKRSSDRSPGESESSGSFSSHSERYSDEQDASRESPNGGTLSPEVTSKATIIDDEMKESVKCLTEKLSAALVNVSAKEDLVKQHAKVAEEAVAGWEKAENEVAALKQQLEGAVQQNVNLEVRASHLDGALKECVRQLRQAREEQEKRLADSILEKNKEWESTKSELEKRILDLETQAEATKAEKAVSRDPSDLLLIEALENENSSLKKQLALRLKELGILTIERDLSTQAAEMASKQQLESNKKVVKLEAECRKLQSVARKSSPANNQKSVTPSSFYAESLTDSNTNGSEPGLDSWATALIAELDHFKNEKPSQKHLGAYTVEIDMDEFLEMERLAALPETKSNTPFAASTASGDCVSVDGSLRAELELMTQRVAELENKLEKIEAEKSELENALEKSRASFEASQSKMAEAEIKLEELQKELIVVNKAKALLEFQLVSMEVETRTMSANIDSLKAENEKERKLSTELSVKCQELENELNRTLEEAELQLSANSNAELKVKQEDLAVAADKLAECQKTIASLGKQLQSLATLEDFLIDTSNIPGLHQNGIFARKSESDPSRITRHNGTHVENGSSEESPPFSSSADQASAVKNRNGFGRFFTRSKSVVEMVNSQE